MRYLLPLLLVVATGCSQESTDSSLPPLEERVALVENFAWTIVQAADDPFGPRPAAGQVCGPGRRAAPEKEFNGFWYTVSTRLCSYAVAQTVLLQNVQGGAEMRARFFHFTINVGDGGWRLVLAIGERPDLVFERIYPVPAKTMLIEESWVAERDYKAGEAVWFHVTNHGVNDWSLVDFTAVGPVEPCSLSDQVCAEAPDWLRATSSGKSGAGGCVV